MTMDRLEQLKSLAVGLATVAALLLIGMPQPGAESAAAGPRLVLEDHSPVAEGHHLAQLSGE